MTEVLEDETRDYTSPEFWERNPEMVATLVTAITLLRLFVSRANRAIEDHYESEADPRARS
jgi:hypothetical protein